MTKEIDPDNAEYLLHKPGFYKKGPGKFMLHFGTLDEVLEQAREKKGLEIVKEEEQEDNRDDFPGDDGAAQAVSGL